MKRARSRIILTLLTTIGIALPFPSSGYNDDGHFFTIAPLQRSHRAVDASKHDEAMLIAFCTQMPDLAKELDAAKLWADSVLIWPPGWTWGAFNACWPSGIRHMVTAHHYIHALTNSPAASVTEAAVAIIARLRSQNSAAFDPNIACAVGFAVHLLGDSFAHRRLKDPDRTYRAGRGHATNLHAPDYIALNSVRASQWSAYVQQLIAAMELDIDPQQAKSLSQIATKHLGGNWRNKFNTDQITTELLEALREPPPDDTNVWSPYNPRLDQLYDPGMIRRHRNILPFDGVVATYRSALPSNSATLNYRATWKSYMAAAIPEFDQRNITSPCSPEAEIQ